MEITRLTIAGKGYPKKLALLPSPPQQLFYIGVPPEELLSQPAVAVVGSRSVSAYGRLVTTKLAGELAAYGITIVSGLALGVDGLAHQAALEKGGKTIAVLPCGLDEVYPRSHHSLAQRILQQGGTLISEYPVGTEPRKENFIARNRIVSGLSEAILITEAAEKSGTLHTANFALDQGREVMAVPGNITSLLSAGTNNLIKTGATPVTKVGDILHVLGLTEPERKQLVLIGATPEEHILLQLLAAGTTESDLLLSSSKLRPAQFNQTLTMLELTGKIKPAGNGNWSLA